MELEKKKGLRQKKSTGVWKRAERRRKQEVRTVN